VRFTTGSIAIADDFTVVGEEGRLMVDFRHKISTAHLRYHRVHYFFQEVLAIGVGKETGSDMLLDDE
jgi:hypothetical protein